MKNLNRSSEFDIAIKSLYHNDLAAFSSAIASINDINETDKVGRTLLFYCILENKIEFIAPLIAKGIDINRKDNEGWSALDCAAQEGRIPIAELLIQNNAIIDIIDSRGNTPLWTAVYEFKESGEMIKLLIRSGADVNKKNNNGVSPKDLAEKIANYNIKQFFE